MGEVCGAMKDVFGEYRPRPEPWASTSSFALVVGVPVITAVIIGLTTRAAGGIA